MTVPKPSPAWQGLRPSDLESAVRQVEAILRRTMPTFIQLIEVFKALSLQDELALDRWESEGGATDA